MILKLVMGPLNGQVGRFTGRDFKIMDKVELPIRGFTGKGDVAFVSSEVAIYQIRSENHATFIGMK